MNTLQSSKRTAEEVTEQLEVSEQTEIKIDAAREVSPHLMMLDLVPKTPPSLFEYNE